MIWKGSGHWLIQDAFPAGAGGTEENHERRSHDNQSPCVDLKPGPTPIRSRRAERSAAMSSVLIFKYENLNDGFMSEWICVICCNVMNGFDARHS
jgi:hypothetical protein